MKLNISAQIRRHAPKLWAWLLEAETDQRHRARINRDVLRRRRLGWRA